MQPPSWLIAAIRWDGIFPMIVGATSLLLIAAFPRNDLVEIAVVILIPILAALIRAIKARDQLWVVCRRNPSLLRQAGMGIAIAILLLFEMLMGLLQAAPGAPLVAWGMAIGLYAIYLAVIVTALRPAAVAVRVTDSKTGVPLSDRTASP